MSDNTLFAHEVLALSKLGQQLAKHASPQALITALHEQLSTWLSVGHLSLTVRDFVTDELVVFIVEPNGLSEKKALKVYKHLPLIDSCFKNKKPQLISLNEPKPKAALLVPVVNEETGNVGVIVLEGINADPFTEKNLSIVQLLAGYLGNSLGEKILSQEKYQLEIQEAALNQTAIVAVADLKGTILKVNEKFCQVSKYTEAELIGQNHNIVNSGYHDNSFWKEMWRTIGSGKIWRGNIRNRAKDGRIYWVDTVITPFLDAKGRPYQYFSIRFEITERQKLHADLIKERRNLHTILSNLQGMAYRCLNDEHYSMEFISEGAETLTGYSAEEMMEGKVSFANDIIYEEDLTLVNQIVDEAVATKEAYTIEYRIQHKDETIIWVTESGRGVYDEQGELLYLEGFINDIHHLKEVEEALQLMNESLQATEEELRQQTEELQTINENLASTLNELKQAQNQLVESEKLAALGQLIANVAHEINTPLGAIQSSVGNMESTLDDIYPQLNRFFKQLAKEHVDLFFQLIRTASDPGLKTAATQTRKLRKTLEKKLAQTTVTDSRKVARELLNMGITEEWENYLPLLLADSEGKILAMAYRLSYLYRSVNTIQIAASRSSKVIYALKNYARYGDSENMRSADLIEGIETTLVLYHNLIKRGVKVKRAYGELPQILCFPDELNQVWMNLIHNALQAMEYSGTLTIGLQKQGQYAVVSLKDTGKGMDNATQAKIFDPFFTTKPVGEGSGLGLGIVTRIVNKHRGTIHFESEEGKGTCFYISIPLEQEKTD